MAIIGYSSPTTRVTSQPCPDAVREINTAKLKARNRRFIFLPTIEVLTVLDDVSAILRGTPTEILVGTSSVRETLKAALNTMHRAVIPGDQD